MRATTAAADPYCTAVALTGLPAEFVSIQRQAASLLPDKNVNSAAGSLHPACQFSGSIAQIATNAVTTATSVTFQGHKMIGQDT